MHDARGAASRERTANLLGATALAVGDVALTPAARAADTSASGAAALVALYSTPGLTVTELGRRVGLSQPAAARMVDALETQGRVARQRTRHRAVSVSLTTSGRRAARRMLTERSAPLTELLDELDDTESELLAGLLAKLLAALYAQLGSAELLCRLCDRRACVRGETCPVGAAQRASRGPGDSGSESHGRAPSGQ